MDGRQRMHRERRVVPIAPASSSGGKGPAKIPDQKAVKKKLESLEAAAKEREADAEWLAKPDDALLDYVVSAALFKGLWGSSDPMRSGDKKASSDPPPAVFGGILTPMGISPSEPSSMLPSFLVDSQMRDTVFGLRQSIAARLVSPEVADQAAALDEAKKLLKVYEKNGGKLPPGFSMADLDRASEEGRKPVAPLPPTVQAAVGGVFGLLSRTAKEYPALCADSLAFLNNLLESLQPQALLGEDSRLLSSLRAFYASLCTDDMIATARLGADIPETKLVPASLAGLTTLAVLSGTKAALLSGVLTLLTRAGRLDDGTSVKFRIPKPLLTLAKVASASVSGADAVRDSPSPILIDRVPLTVDGVDSADVPIALAASGPYVYAVLGRKDVLVKLGSGALGSTRGQLVATVAGVHARFVAECGCPIPSLQHSLLWMCVLFGEKPLVLLREQSMRPGVFLAYDGTTLEPAGVYCEAVSGDNAGVELEESKGNTQESDSKSSDALTASSAGAPIGLGVSAFGVFDDASFVTLSISSLPPPFFPEDSPIVLADDPSTAWPPPLCASFSLNSYAVSSAERSFKRTGCKALKWCPSPDDCERIMLGTPAWMTHPDEIAAASTVSVLPPISKNRKPLRPVFMACTATASLWLTDAGDVYYEGIAVSLGSPNSQLAAQLTSAGTERFKRIAAAPHAAHVLLLTDTGCVFALGDGDQGQLGHGKNEKVVRAVAVNFTGGGKKGGKGDKPVLIHSIAVGSRSSLAVSCDGKVYAWGAAIPPAIRESSNTPKLLPLPSLSSPVSGCAMGAQHAVLWSEGGEIITFGANNEQHKLGRTGDDSSPLTVTLPGANSPINISTVVCGDGHSVVLTGAGEVFTFGVNTVGQCGVVPDVLDAPALVLLPGPAISIAAGAFHSLALLADGRVFGWGKCSDGALGHTRGSLDAVRAPVEIPALSSPRSLRVFASGQSSTVMQAPAYVSETGLRTASLLVSHATQTLSVLLPTPASSTLPFTAILPDAAGGGPQPLVASVNEARSAPALCRVFRLSTGKHVRDGDVPFSAVTRGDGMYTLPAACCADVGTGVTWAAGVSNDNLPVLEIHSHAPTLRSPDADLSGSSWLLEPQFALSWAPNAETTAEIASGTLLAVVDAMYTRYTNDIPDDVSSVNPSSIVGSTKKRTSMEPEECCRYEPTSVVNSWGMGSTDSVVFRVDQECMLMGLGVYGGNSKCKISSWVTEGRVTAGEKLGEFMFDIEDTTMVVHPGMFDTPVRLKPDTDYCMADKSVGPSIQGHMAQKPKDPSGKVVMECGITVTYSQTGDASNNGTSPTRGRCAALYILPMIAFRARGDDDDDETNSSDSLPVIQSKALSLGMDADTLSVLLSIIRWCSARLSTPGCVSPALNSILMFSLRQLRLCLDDPGLTSVVDSEVSSPPPSWVSSDPEMYGTMLWDIDTLLRSIMSTSSDGSNAVRQEAQRAFITLFDTLYPTRKLKQRALHSLLSDTHRGVLLSAVMDALSTRDDVAMFLLADEPSSVSPVLADEQPTDGGFEESKEENVFTASADAALAIVRDTPSPKKTAVKAVEPERLTPFLAAVEQVLSALQASVSSVGSSASRKGGVSLMLSLLSTNFNSAIASTAAFVVPPFIRSAVRLLHAMLRDTVKGLTAADTVAVPQPSSSKLGPLQRVSKYQSVTSSWGNGSQDAFCFTVDTPVYISGIGMYGYSKGAEGEQRVTFSLHEGDGTSLLASGEGTFNTMGSEIPGEVLFDEPVLIDPDTKYSVRAVINTGGSTFYGRGTDKCTSEDGINWAFSSSSQSPNGTSSTGGQIPLLLYQLPRKVTDVTSAAVPPLANRQSEATNILITQVNCVLATAIDLLQSVARNGLTPQSLSVLSADAFFAELLPLVMVDLARVVVLNQRVSAAMVPHLSALTRLLDGLVMPVDAAPGESQGPVVNGAPLATNYRHVVLETDHPYGPAQVVKWDIVFPPSVSWLVLEFDPRCSTGQSEDRVSIFADSDLRGKVGIDYYGPAKGDASSWPSSLLVLPGNRVTVVFSSATDYGNTSADARFGLSATVTGQSAVTSPLRRFQCEVARVLGVCLAQSLSPQIVQTPSPPAEVEDSGKGGKKKKSKRGPGAQKASSEKWVVVPDAVFDESTSNNIILSEDGTKVAQSAGGYSYALLDRGLERGKLAYEIVVVAEKMGDESTAVGCAIKTGLAPGKKYSDAPFATYRFYNAGAYCFGRDLGKKDTKVHQGDRVRVEIDMDEGKIRYLVNDKDLGDVIVFNGEVEEVFPAVCFYSTGREVKLELVEVSGDAIADFGLAPKVVDAIVPGNAATLVPPSVFTAIGGGLFAGGLAIPAMDPHFDEKQRFVAEFMHGAADTSGGRLAAWLVSVTDAERAAALCGRRLEPSIVQGTAAPVGIAGVVPTSDVPAAGGGLPPLLPTALGVPTPSQQTDTVTFEWSLGPGPQQLGMEYTASVLASFSATLWQHGLVFEAMAASAYLKFHPEPPAPSVLEPLNSASEAYAVVCASTDASVPAGLRCLLAVFRCLLASLLPALITEWVEQQKQSAKATALAPPVKSVESVPASSGLVDATAVAESSSDDELDDGHALVKYRSPSVKCVKCGMLGPSPQTGSEECTDCRLCEKCCERDEKCAKATKDTRGRGATLAAQGYGGFPMVGGGVPNASDSKKKEKKKKGKGKRDDGDDDLVPIAVKKYVKSLQEARKGLPLQFPVSQLFGGPDGFERDVAIVDGSTITVVGEPDFKRPAAVVGAPFEPQDCLRYFEVKVEAASRDGMLCFGWQAHKSLPLNKHIGHAPYSFGYASNGALLHSGFPDAPPFSVGDVIGVGWACKEVEGKENLNYTFFTRNGTEVLAKYWNIRSGPSPKLPHLAPAISCHSSSPKSVILSVNSGAAPFMFGEAEVARLAALARGECPGAVPSISGVKSSEPLCVGLLKRAKLLLTVEPTVSDAESAPPKVKTVVGPSSGVVADVSSLPVHRGLDLALPGSKPVLSRSGSSGTISASPRAPPALRRAVSTLAPSEDVPHDDVILTKPSTGLLAAATAAGAPVGARTGVSPQGSFVKGLDGVLAFLASTVSADVFGEALQQRQFEAHRRLEAIRVARTLLEGMRTPEPLQQILWFIGSALTRKLPGYQRGDENPVLRDLKGCGGALYEDVQSEFHALLDSVSRQIVNPCGSAPHVDGVESPVPVPTDLQDEQRMVQMLALRCWRAPLGSGDHTFLQSCSLFGNLQSIMSGSETSAATPTVSTAKFRDVTSQFVPSVSTNKDRLYCLTDSTTDTFWEPVPAKASDPSFVNFVFGKSADGTLAKDPVADVGNPVDICAVAVHVDCVRDKSNTPSTLKLFSGPSPDFLSQVPDDVAEVPPAKFAGWILLVKAGGPISAKCLQVSVVGKSGSKCRIRGVRLYTNAPSASPALALDVKTEALHVFREVAEGVFAGLNSDAVPPDSSPALLRRPSSDLRERVAGMVFGAGGGQDAPLKALQHHLFSMIGTELTREKDRRVSSRAWTKKQSVPGEDEGAEESKGDVLESDSKVVDAAPVPIQPTGRDDDSYCFELVCMLSSLSDTVSGRASVAQPVMLGVLLSLLPVGSPRVQRQILVILRRVLTLVDPAALDGKLFVPLGLLQPSLDAKLIAESRSEPHGDALSQAADKKRGSGRGAAVAWLLLTYAKSFDVQVRGRADGRPVSVNTMMPEDIMEGSVQSDVASGIKSLLEACFTGAEGSAVVGGPFTGKWKSDMYTLVRGLLLTLASQLSNTVFAPARSAHLPQLWASLAVLASVGQRLGAPQPSDADLTSESELLKPLARVSDDSSALLSRKRLCENHDDGTTEAAWACAPCVFRRDSSALVPTLPPTAQDLGEEEVAMLTGYALCESCDHGFHLHRNLRNHKRVPIKLQSEEGLKVEYVGGCSRIKLGWLHLSMFEDKGKAMLEFKREASRGAAAVPTCRFCECDITAENRQSVVPVSPALEFVCASEECQEKAANSCTRTLDCGHLCGGVRGEERCLPCYQGCDGAALERDSFCTICYTEPLGAGPAIRLVGCGHGFHFLCVKRMLEARWNGPRMNFSFMNCPLCKSVMDHPSLKPLVDPLLELRKVVREKALLRLKYENKDKCAEITSPDSEWFNDPEGYAEHKFAYYMCFKCGKPYYGGEVACAAAGAAFDPSEFICGGCAPWSGDLDCPKHGKDFIEFKCRYCCSVAVWFCFGTTHFCEPCHSRHSSPGPGPCPWRAGKKYDGDKCPLGVAHPPTGEEFPLGCGVCRNAQTF